MSAMFGNHVQWDQVKVFTGKGRPLGGYFFRVFSLFRWSTLGFNPFFFIASVCVRAHLKLVLTTPRRATLARPVRTCSITGQPAKYLDPKTNVPFANVGAYEVLAKVIGRGYVWCSALGCYVGTSETSRRDKGPGGEAGGSAVTGTDVAEGVAGEQEDMNVEDEVEELEERTAKRRRVEVTDA